MVEPLPRCKWRPDDKQKLRHQLLVTLLKSLLLQRISYIAHHVLELAMREIAEANVNANVNVNANANANAEPGWKTRLTMARALALDIFA